MDQTRIESFTGPARVCVGALPGRKKPCLYVEKGGAIYTLARFDSDWHMREFLSFNPTFTPRDSNEG